MDDMKLRELISDADKAYETDAKRLRESFIEQQRQADDEDGVFVYRAAVLIAETDQEPYWHRLWPVAYALMEEDKEKSKTSR